MSHFRNSQAACVRADYLQSKMDEYRAKTGQQHPAQDHCLNLVWARLPYRMGDANGASGSHSEHLATTSLSEG